MHNRPLTRGNGLHHSGRRRTVPVDSHLLSWCIQQTLLQLYSRMVDCVGVECEHDPSAVLHRRTDPWACVSESPNLRLSRLACDAGGICFHLIPLVANLFARQLLKPIEIFGALWHFIALIVISAVLIALGGRNSAEFVFTGDSGGVSGWTNGFVSWNLGMLAAALPLTGKLKLAKRRRKYVLTSLLAFDGALHLSKWSVAPLIHHSPRMTEIHPDTQCHKRGSHRTRDTSTKEHGVELPYRLGPSFRLLHYSPVLHG